MAEGDPQVQPSVVVEIEKFCSPGAVIIAEMRQTPEKRCVGEGMRALILVERVILPDPVGDEYVQQAIVVVIADGYAHRTLGIAVPIDGQPRFKARVLECTVTVVNVKEIRTHVVDLIDILKPVIVEVAEDHPKAPAGVLADQARSFGHIRKSSVAVVMVEDGLLAFEVIRRAGDGDPFHHTRMGLVRPRSGMRGVQFDKVCHIEVQITIVVVVSKRSPHAPFGEAPMRIPDARRFANFRESAVPIISIELVRTKAGDVEIGKAVVIVVARGAAAVPAAIP